MCTQAEVREVIRSEAPPKWTQYLINFLGTGILVLLSWILYSVHDQASTLADIRTVNKVSIATLTGKVELLATNLNNIKEIAIDRSDDRWTGRDAKSRNLLVDERCGNMKVRIIQLEEAVENIQHNRGRPL